MTQQIKWENRIVSSGTEDPEQLLANPLNFRRHPAHQKKAMTGVLSEIGWIQDVIVNKVTGHIIDGHLRVELAMQRSEKVPVKYVELSEHEEKIALASIDPIGALAEQDQAMLDDLIEDIGTVENDDLSAFLDSMLSDGPDLDEAEEEGLIDDDECPDAPTESVIKPGDVFILGDHRVICGDSTNMDDIDKLMAGEQADMLWIDPPYNADNDNVDDSAFRNFLRDLFSNCTAVMKAGSPFYIAHADSEGYNFRGAAQESGLDVKQCLIWVNNSIAFCRQDHHWQHEPILYGWKPGAAHKWYGEFNKSTVIDEQPKVNDLDRSELMNLVRELRNTLATTVIREDKPKANGDHPTMKPIRLIGLHLKNSTRRGDVVIDFCGGSGSTLIACEKLGRKARLCELSPTYAQVIVERWQEFTGKDAILEDTGQTFDQLTRGRNDE